jgi:hypothetical protein
MRRFISNFYASQLFLLYLAIWNLIGTTFLFFAALNAILNDVAIIK